MRWPNCPSPSACAGRILNVAFVRPVHWVLLLFGGDVVDTTVMGLRTGRITYGHRFHHPDAVSIQQAVDYPGALHNPGHVVADFAVRRAAIRTQVEAAAGKAGGQAVIDPALLDEVTALVEWPVALLGRFEERFLQVPQEALISTMKGNQKYFSRGDSAGRLLPYFITLLQYRTAAIPPR